MTSLRTRIWKELDELVRTHRSFPDADWTLPTPVLDRLAALAEKFLPDDVEAAHAWLFAQQLPHVGGDAFDYATRDAELAAMRQAAVRAISDKGGTEALLRFATSVEQTGFVGRAAAEAGLELDDTALTLLDADDSRLSFFAMTYFFSKTARLGQGWTHSQIDRAHGRALAQARLLQGLDDLEDAWHTAEQLGPEVEAAYWKEFAYFGRGHDFRFVDRVARALLRFGRPLAGLDFMALFARRADRPLDPALVAQALEVLPDLPTDHPEPQRISAYEIDELLDYLRVARFDETRLAIIEWRLLPAREFNAQSPVLERQLARDPALFVEVLSLIYKPRDTEAKSEVPEHLARNAYRLISEWSVVPGATEHGVDETFLATWVADARHLSDAAKRREVADVHIGRVLARAGGDPDGTWPAKAVRSVIERVASADIEDGLYTQIINDRGPTSRGLLDGGRQEHDLANRWHQRAAAILDEWPRTAAVLRRVAQSYERDGRDLDAESERVRQGLDR